MQAAPALLASLLLLSLLPPRAHAGDGRTEINQARALAGGVTAGDTPGFPVTIDAPGNYVLTSDLEVPNANTTAILPSIFQGDFEIDLSGFEIRGPTACGNPANNVPNLAQNTTCVNTGTGDGIGQFLCSCRLTLRNGRIRGMGSAGVRLADRVEGVAVSSNGGFGINAREVIGCTAERNGADGITVGSQGLGALVRDSLSTQNVGHGIRVLGAPAVLESNRVIDNQGDGISTTFARQQIQENTIEANNGDGIDLAGGPANVVLDNFIFGNGLVGLKGSAFTGYGNNVLDSNVGGDVSGGPIALAPNLCSGVLCP